MLMPVYQQHYVLQGAVRLKSISYWQRPAKRKTTLSSKANLSVPVLGDLLMAFSISSSI